jgi:hypothetical protein
MMNKDVLSERKEMMAIIQRVLEENTHIHILMQGWI